MLHRFWLGSVVLVLLLLAAAPAALASGYVYKDSFGRPGTAAGEFSWPGGLAVDGRGALYVADGHNHRVQKFTTKGVFLASVGTYGSELGQFSWPLAPCLDSTGRLLIGEYSGGRVQVLSRGLTPLSSWGAYGAGPSQFSGISAIATDSTGAVYVADIEGGRVQKFSVGFGYVTEWATDYPGGIAIDEDDTIYVSNWAHGTISVFDSSGTLLRTIGAPGTAPGELATPAHLAFAPDDSLIVAEGWGVGRVSRFDPHTGEFLGVVAPPGSGPGEVLYAFGVAVDSTGDLFVSDPTQNKILRFAWDATPPVVTHDYDGEWHSTPVTLRFTATDEVAGGARVLVSRDDGQSWTETDTLEFEARADHTNDGVHKVIYKAVDALDNWTATKTVRVRIDTRRPRTAVAGAPAGWTRSDVWLTLTASDVGSGVGGIHYRIGTPWWLDVPGDGVVGLGSEGVHTFEYYAWDNAVPSNVEAQKSLTVRIDKTKPSPVASNAITVVKGGTATFKYTLLDNLSPTCTVTLVIKKDTKTVRTVALGTKASPLQVPPKAYSKALAVTLPVGAYTWTVTAKDLAGNSKTALAKRLTVK